MDCYTVVDWLTLALLQIDLHILISFSGYFIYQLCESDKKMENMQMYECVSIYAIAYVIISEWDKTDRSI